MEVEMRNSEVVTLRRGRKKVCSGNRRIWWEYDVQTLKEWDKTRKSWGHRAKDLQGEGGNFITIQLVVKGHWHFPAAQPPLWMLEMGLGDGAPGWLSQLSVQLLISTQVMISQFVRSSPGSSSVLTTWSLLGILFLSFSLCPSPFCALSLSLSK